MKRLPDTMRFRLLEGNPVPLLNEMITFSSQCLAVRSDALSSKLFCAAAKTPVTAESPSEPAVQELLSAVKELQVQQKAVVAALSTDRPSSWVAGPSCS